MLAALGAADGRLGTGAHLVGGFVRDELLGLESRDLDVVLVAGAPEQLLGELARTLGWPPPVVFERFGTAHAAGGGVIVEAVRARSEAYDPASRRPAVRPGTLEEDMRRRDFTLNALCRPVAGGPILDLTGRGRADLSAGVLRTPLDPVETMGEDPLRLLRAARLASTHGFRPAPGLLDAMRTTAPRCSILSVERVTVELRRLLPGDHVAAGVGLLVDSGVLAAVIPETDPAPPDPAAVAAAPAQPPAVRLALLLRGLGGGAAAAALTRLRFSNEEIAAVRRILDLDPGAIAAAGSLDDTSLRRLALDAGAWTAQVLAAAAAIATAAGTGAAWIEVLPARLAGLDPAGSLASGRPPLDGATLVALAGRPPGPWVGDLQRRLLEALVAGHLRPGDREAALAWARRLLLDQG